MVRPFVALLRLVTLHPLALPIMVTPVKIFLDKLYYNKNNKIIINGYNK